MRYEDCVYGEFEITEPIILELINSPSLQRLKNIDQGGYRPLLAKSNIHINKYDYNRFAHSVGVYLLLKKYKAPLEEQISGLIHDVSHSVFSHCIDYILDVGSGKEQNHQDNCFNNFIKKTEIPGIIKKHGFDLEYILNDENFPLKEKNLPDLCADRIDYSLKTASIFGEQNNRDKDYILDNLIVENNNWLFKDLKSAKKYAELFLKLNTVYYSGLSSAIMFKAVGDCIKHALEKKYITENDLYKTDDVVLEKIQKFLDKDKKLNLFWNRMNNNIKADNNPNDYDAQVFCKSRVVDPLFKDNGVLKRLSETEISWSDIIKKELEPKEYFIKFTQ